MGSTFHGLELGKRSLFAQQAALSTTGHNISNANSKGFTRQRVELEASHSISYPGMNNDRSPRQLGTGVQPSEIIRMREDYLDQQFRTENKTLGYWQTTSDIYAKLEGMINEPSDSGLQSLMDQFWQGWQDLAKNPESLEARAVVRERAITLADGFKHVTDSLDQLDNDLANVMQTKVSEINSIAVQINDLNSQIKQLVPHGHNPNDLYDKRDLLIDQLSKLVNVEVKPAEHGMVEVLVRGQTLVSPTEVVPMAYDSGTNELSLGGTELALTSGELLAVMNGRGQIDENGQATGIITNMRQQIELHAMSFVRELNGVHQAGYTTDDIQAYKADPNATPASLLFFVDANDPSDPPGPPKSANSIAVNPLILESLNRIAASSKPNEGDGLNAQKIAAKKFETISIGGQNSTLDDFFRYTIAQLGVRSQESLRMSENSEVLVGQIDNQRQSVSGVSLDEEMTNMMKYQQAYNAAARFVTAIDEILDKVVNGMGRVGL